MNIVVCVKQIPDPANPGELDPESHFLVRPADQVMDDGDRYGVEMALQLAEVSEGTVTLVSMGPPGNLQGIRQALAMGAAKAVVITDDALRGAGALETARVLAAAITREGFDLVLCGTESTDGYSGIVPQQVAELLGVPALTYARKVELDGSTVKIEQQTAAGYNEVEAPTPVVLSVTAGVVEPRYPTFKGIMAAKSKPIDQLTLGDLSIDTPGAGQEIVAVTAAPGREAGVKIEDDGEGYLAIVSKLQELKVV
jgi:electron transfer flavoprotein beta subunit